MRGDQCVWVIWCGGVAVSVSCGVLGFQRVRSWCYPNNDPKPKSVTKSNPKTDGVVGVVKRVRRVDTGVMFTPPAPVAVVHCIVSCPEITKNDFRMTAVVINYVGPCEN